MKYSIEYMKAFAEKRGGKCLSKTYRNTKTKLKWSCACGNEWEAIFGSIRRGTWCPVCGIKKASVRSRRNINDMRVLAKSRGGKCLSRTYRNPRTKLKWRCAEGHEWEAVPYSIKHGTWCPVCGIKKQSAQLRGNIKKMKAVAKSRGGECLSNKYINNRTKLKWRCAEGHEWEAVPYSIKSGTWCPVCGRKKASQTKKQGKNSSFQN